ncbi:MAG TPA: LysM peptidoglycan-binding domain-containing protein [Bacilli bacterium]|nr:LysM peptidoglycan-binding domain-containing protein [Bacilli bacterium]
MYVYLVKKGETLPSIARSVGVDPDELSELNQIYEETPVPGTSLLVPTSVATELVTYTVQRGDTLRKVTGRFRMPEKIALAANRSLHAEDLTEGRILTLPIPRLQKAPLEVNLRLELEEVTENRETVEDARPALSSFSASSVLVDGEGGLHFPLNNERHVEMLAHHAKCRSLVLVQPFDDKAARRVLYHSPSRRHFFANLMQWVAADSFSGVHLEFLGLAPEHRFQFNGFVRELATRVRQKKGVLYVGVPPHYEDDPQHLRAGAYDLSLIGQYADRVVWNVDEAYGRTEGPPMSLAPYHLIQRTLLHALTVVQKRKLLLGLPFYGYDWARPYTSDSHPYMILHGPPTPETDVVELPKQVLWDERALSPMFVYRDGSGDLREAWYEDARSIAAKLHLVQALGLAGISGKVYGATMPALWQMIADSYEIA